MPEISITEAIEIINGQLADGELNLGPDIIYFCKPLELLVMPGHEPCPGIPDSAKCLGQQFPSVDGKQLGLWFHIHDARDSPGQNVKQYVFGMAPACHCNACSWKPAIAFVDYQTESVEILWLDAKDLAHYFHSGDSGDALINSFELMLDQISENASRIPQTIASAKQRLVGH